MVVSQATFFGDGIGYNSAGTHRVDPRIHRVLYTEGGDFEIQDQVSDWSPGMHFYVVNNSGVSVGVTNENIDWSESVQDGYVGVFTLKTPNNSGGVWIFREYQYNTASRTHGESTRSGTLASVIAANTRSTIAAPDCDVWALTRCGDATDILYSRQLGWSAYEDELMQLSVDDATTYRLVTKASSITRPVDTRDLLSTVEESLEGTCTIYKLTHCEDVSDYLLTPDPAWSADAGKAVELSIDAADVYRGVSVASEIDQALDTRDLRSLITETFADCVEATTSCTTVDPGDECTHCDDVTPSQYQVTFSGVRMGGCDFVGRNESAEIVPNGGWDINGTFTLTQQTGLSCRWGLLLTNVITRNTYTSSETCSGTPTTSDQHDMKFWLTKTSSGWRLEVFTELSPFVSVGFFFAAGVAADTSGGTQLCATITATFNNSFDTPSIGDGSATVVCL